jgi:hypothetical protein
MQMLVPLTLMSRQEPTTIRLKPKMSRRRNK